MRARAMPGIFVLLRGLAAAGALLLTATGAVAEPLARDDVPEPLRPWIDWVLWDAPDADCPSVHGLDLRQCVWPARLHLELGSRSGTFRQEWFAWRDAWVPLPGDADLWPQNTRVDATPAVVVARGGVPSVRLSRGRHVLEGEFRWKALPEGLAIPAQTGLVSLELEGREIPFPDREATGRLWLRRRQAPETGAAASIEVVVHRKLRDDVPLLLDSRLELRVSGPAREIALGPALPAGFAPMAIDSPLPARVEADRRLRVQVRPGTWSLRLLARHEPGPASETGPPDAQGDWDRDEVWVFEAVPELRLAEVEGAPAIDPQQTQLPAEWRSLPAYLLEAGSRLRLIERRRGDADPAPDQLELSRQLWLDFDGGGYTVRDQLTGQLRRSWRLEASERLELGRVAIDGSDQQITRLDGTPGRGVEIRQGKVDVQADSRIEGNTGVPAVGWNHDLNRLDAVLHLPPGWKLFHAGGVDAAATSWISGWSLLEMFLVLVFSMAIGQLWGPLWGGLALVALALSFPESGAPRYAWLFLLSAEALRRVAPEGRFRRALQALWAGTLIALGLIAIPFAIQQLREAAYPSLERTGVPGGGVFARRAPEAELLEMDMARAQPAEGLAKSAPPMPARARTGKIDLFSASSESAFDLRTLAPDPAARISTGPGVPAWKWRSVQLRWQGPVDAAQQLDLWLVGPGLNLLLGFVRVGLLTLLILCVLGQGPRVARWLRRGPRASATAGALAAALLASTGPVRADAPTDAQLAELRERLLRRPECHPECAASASLRLDVDPDSLRALVEIDVAWPTAVPLPGGLLDWTPARVTVNGRPARQLARAADGALLLQLPPGRHRVELSGPLPPRATVDLPLPLPPRRVEATIEGWTLNGLRDDARPGGNLQLVRLEPSLDAGAALEPGELPVFLRVERTLQLGLDWQVVTQVERLTPPGRGAFVSVPLLPGESVHSDAVRVESGHARISLGAQERRVRWTSTLPQTPEIALSAAGAGSWSETWRVDASPVWHLETRGIPATHSAQPVAHRRREWRPWPGESVSLSVTRPAGVDGPVLTVDSSRLELDPGIRALGATLHLTLRASQGMQFPLRLPEGAELESVRIDGRTQPLRQVEGELELPVSPGAHVAIVHWRESRGLTSRFETPRVDLGRASVNPSIELRLSPERWILLTGGPRLGPAVLFWSVLAVIALLALGLAKLRLTPLGAGSWLLLFLGLTQVPLLLGVMIAGWLLALGLRGRHTPAPRWAFGTTQVLLGLWTLAALGALLFAVHRGLLGHPEMQIAGNGSGAGALRWYQDRADAELPTAWVLSLPVWIYRIFMLAWALWLARALLSWLRWGWSCFGRGGLWPARPAPQAPAPE